MLKNNGFHNRKRLYFSPSILFANGEQGAWYDPSDITTMFQDSAGTMPVTAVGQPVGRILDKSGRGNHASQAIELNCPSYSKDTSGRAYLAFDGSNDALITASINFTATNNVNMWAGVQKLSNAARGVIVELSTVYAIGGAFAIDTPINNFAVNAAGTAAVSLPIAADMLALTVITGLVSIATPFVQQRRNGSVVGTATNSLGTGNFSNNPLYIGSRAGTSLPFNGNIYSLIIRGAQSSDYQIAATENYVNGKTGAY